MISTPSAGSASSRRAAGAAVATFGDPSRVPGRLPARSATLFPVTASASNTQCAEGSRFGFGAAAVGRPRYTAAATSAAAATPVAAAFQVRAMGYSRFVTRIARVFA